MSKIHYVERIDEVESSNIKSLAYNMSTKIAFVLFKNSSIYMYKDVTNEDYQELLSAESVGRHFQTIFLKKNREYIKLKEEDKIVKEEERLSETNN